MGNSYQEALLKEVIELQTKALLRPDEVGVQKCSRAWCGDSAADSPVVVVKGVDSGAADSPVVLLGW